MKKLRKLSLKEELEKEAAEIEKELEAHPELDELKVSKELDDAIYAEIHNYEKEQEENKIKELPIRTYKKKRKMKLAVALVAVLVLVMGMSVSSVGSKSYMKELIEKFTGKSQVDVTNVKDMDSMENEDVEEAKAYQEIDDKLNTQIVRIRERPRGMQYQSYFVDENINQVNIYYVLNNKSIRYDIYTNYNDSSKGSIKADIKIDEYTMKVQDVEIRCEERKIEDRDEKLQIAEYEYKGVYYQLKGIMQKEDMKKIIKNLFFY